MLYELSSVSFSQVIDDLAQDGYAVLDHFIPADLAITLLAELNQRKLDGAFSPAGIGKSGELSIDQQIRSDQILWLSEFDQNEAIRNWFARIHLLSEALRQELRLPIKRYEGHFAHYPQGTFYKKHLDAFKTREGRLISVICYLTPNWQKGDGGELLVYNHLTKPAHCQEIIEKIEPVMGRLVLLQSELIPHEVALSRTDRYSITGWLRQDEAIL